MTVNESNEAKGIVFTEYIKKVDMGGEESYADFHLTVRDDSDEQLLVRLKWWDTNLTNMGFIQCDAPKKMQYPARGGGNWNKDKKADATPIKEIANPDGTLTGRGDFEVGSVALFKRNMGEGKIQNNIKAFGVGGEECVSWEGKAMDAALKTMGVGAAEFTSWADWKQDEQHVINWATHRLIAHCKKSAIKTDADGKQTGGKWYIDSLEVTNK